MTNQQTSKRIAKNTLLLYFRMFITMGVSLYTSRVVLNTLGVIDYGIFNVVGGVIVLFAFLNNSMSSATQRFLSFELGANNQNELKRVFSMSINIHIVIAFAIFLIAEALGLWFINTQLTIPPGRISAANWVYQFAIFSFMLTVINVPYNAIIISHERMNVFAWISIIEVLLKLLIVYLLVLSEFDKLKLYSVLVFLVSLLLFTIYRIYCRINLPETRYKFFKDKPLFKKLINYAIWNLWGNAAASLMDQGINILLNIFFGPAVNAARAISYQVSAAVNGFVSNFQMAMNPQIIKSFAADDLTYMHKLIFQGAKFSFFLLFFLSLPILIETDFILTLWLKNVPDLTVIFTRLVIIGILINSVSGPLMTAAQASGKIKLYQSIVGGLLLLILPLSYILLKLGYNPQSTLYVSIFIFLVALIARLKIISPLINLSVNDYVIGVLGKILPVVLFSLVPTLIIFQTINNQMLRLFTTIFISFITVLTSVYWFGLTNNEKSFVISKIKTTLNLASK